MDVPMCATLHYTRCAMKTLKSMHSLQVCGTKSEMENPSCKILHGILEQFVTNEWKPFLYTLIVPVARAILKWSWMADVDVWPWRKREGRN